MFGVFFLFVCALCGVFIGISYHYRNPYKLVFMFGKKGAGKSLLMVKRMLKYIKKGWTVYTDIADVNIDGVRIINADDLKKFVPVENSALFLDEVGISMDNRNFKNFDSGLRDFFKLQRKYKCLVFMNSQAFDVDKKVRDTTDSMELITSIGNVFCLVRPINRVVTLVEASAQGDSRIADNLKFAGLLRWQVFYMPKYFKYFKSFNAPHREPIPYKLVKNDLHQVKKDKNVLDVFKRLNNDEDN